MKYSSSDVEFTKVYEYGHSNNPDDPGKETLNGISRVSFPDWAAWKLVDAIKKETNNYENLDKALETPEIIKLTDEFYKKWWSDHHCDEMPRNIAVAFYDLSFMTGKAVWVLQRAINFLKALGGASKILDDNIWGKYTRDAMNEEYKLSTPYRVVDIMTYKRGKYQMLLQDMRPFYRGWAERTFNLGLYIQSEMNPKMIK